MKITNIVGFNGFTFTLDDGRVFTVIPKFDPITQSLYYPDVPTDVAILLDFVRGKDNFTKVVSGIFPNTDRNIGYLTMQNNSIPTPISAINTPVKALGATTLSEFSKSFTSGVNGRLVYTGLETQIFKVTIQSALTSGSNNNIGLHLGKNGITVPGHTHLTANAGGRVEDAALQVLLELAPNDYIEVFVENTTGANAIILTDASIIATND